MQGHPGKITNNITRQSAKQFIDEEDFKFITVTHFAGLVYLEHRRPQPSNRHVVILEQDLSIEKQAGVAATIFGAVVSSYFSCSTAA